MEHNIRRVLRYIRIYGIKRTLIKVAGRTRKNFLSVFFKKKAGKKEISLIGCGQLGFSTISYFLNEKIGNHFLECFDIDDRAAKTTGDFWGYTKINYADKLISNSSCKYVYIASDHFSHSSYTIEALRKGKKVYCEKPISVTKEQLYELVKVWNQTKGEVYFGYNRPFSNAIKQLSKIISGYDQPMTLSCFISAEKLDADHWYLIPKEGTRICGNLGHWIDLSLYLFSIRSATGNVPNEYDISICYGNENIIDDNIIVSYSTDFGDVITLTITSRAKPFEGVNESINLQCGDLIVKIDDFQNMKIWQNERAKTYRYFHKDVGHMHSVLQPFEKYKRDPKIVFLSTLLMLQIKEMALDHKTQAHYCFNIDDADIVSLL